MPSQAEQHPKSCQFPNTVLQTGKKDEQNGEYQFLEFFPLRSCTLWLRNLTQSSLNDIAILFSHRGCQHQIYLLESVMPSSL